MTDEQVELMRQCAQRVVDNHAAGRIVDPYTLDWARHIVDLVAPLDRPLGDGTPRCACMPAPAFPADDGLLLECAACQ